MQNNNNNNNNFEHPNPFFVQNKTIHLLHFSSFTQIQYYKNNQLFTYTFPFNYSPQSYLIPYLIQHYFATKLNYNISNSELNISQPINQQTTSELINYILTLLFDPFYN